MDTTSIPTKRRLRRGTSLIFGFAFLLCGCDGGLLGVLFQTEAPAVQPPNIQNPPQENNLNNPMLRELRKHVEDAEDFDELGADPDDLLKSLDDADRVLTRIQQENRIALRNVNRQPRAMLPARSPNVVLIVAPRMGIGDLGSYGQTKIPTPHLDALANSGVRLTDFYAGDPTLAGSHWSLHTSWTASRTKEDFGIEERTCTLAEALWQGGYHTAFYGMWLAPDNATKDDSPLKHGFDEWTGQLLAKDALTAYPKTLWVNDTQIELPAADPPVSGGDLIVRAAVQELEQTPEFKRPFFLMIVLPPYLDMAAEFADQELSKNTDWPTSAQSYGAAVRMTDREVGRIVAAIERSGLAGRTSVFFTALAGANPDHAQATDYFQSAGPYKTHPSGLGEANLRVPFLAAFPGVIRSGEAVTHPAAMWDLWPTFIEFTFTQRFRKGMDGVSFAPLLKTTANVPPHLLYWETPGGTAQAVRLRHWKGIRPAAADQLELYDLSSDPSETRNVADQYPEIIEQMVKPPAPEN